MGLDMYLTASKYEPKSTYRDGEAKDNEVFSQVINAINAETFLSNDFPAVQIEVNVGYWRKANAIHGWFVKNVQGGEDNCGRYYVSREALVELQETCIKALADRDSNVLDPTDGFFFGSSEKDEYWETDLRDTVTMIGKLLKTVPEGWTFYYQSSW
jgi:hypothetical protein